MTSKENVTNVSVNAFPFASVLTIAFIVLKLTGFIDWSWWWVLSPLWISFLVFVAFIVLAILVAFVVVLVQNKRDRKRSAQKRARELERRRQRYGGQ